MAKPAIPDAVRRAGMRLRWPPDEVARRPPACPPGWRTGPPDFVGVGVQKAGTSWWFRVVADHPDVYFDDRLPKELHFFDGFFDREIGPAEAAAYARFFPRPDGGISGEWTPRYLADFWVPAQLRTVAPDARILVLLRDPVSRYQSGVTHALAAGARRRPIVAEQAVSRGMYGAQVRRLLRHFPRGQLLLLQYELVHEDPLPFLRDTYRFLGLSRTDHRPGILTDRINETTFARAGLPAGHRAELVELYTPDVLALRELWPQLDLSRWPSFAHLAEWPADPPVAYERK